MRPVYFRCPNHIHCLLAYRGEDIEVTEGMDPVCPECGTRLERKTEPRTSWVPALISWTLILLLAAGAWFAWPYLLKGWKALTSTPEEPVKKAPK